MKIKELIETNSTRHGESLFEATGPNGPQVFCFDSFRFPNELESLLKQYPDLMEWEVAREFMDGEKIEP